MVSCAYNAASSTTLYSNCKDEKVDGIVKLVVTERARLFRMSHNVTPRRRGRETPAGLFRVCRECETPPDETRKLWQYMLLPEQSLRGSHVEHASAYLLLGISDTDTWHLEETLGWSFLIEYATTSRLSKSPMKEQFPVAML